MTKLTPEELDEIERKVARFREVVTKAAFRRAQKRDANPEASKRRQMRELLRLPGTEITVLQQAMAGVDLKNSAAQYGYKSDFMRNYIRDVVLDQFEYISQDYSCDWHKCLAANRKEFYAVWLPLALQRMLERHQPP